jgi:hypothetical protein
MQIAFSYPSGRRVFAVVLAVGADFIRVVAPRRADGFDIYLCDHDWVTETGKTVRIDEIVFGDGALLPSAASPIRPNVTRKKVEVVVRTASRS